MTQLRLVDPEVSAPTGAHDALDRYYTPQGLASAIVDRLEPEALALVLEPSCGGGAFVRALQRRGCIVVGCDLDPGAEGLRRCDLAHAGPLETFAGIECLAWAIGNPPFGGPRSEPAYLGAHHALICLRHAPRVALILPAAWALYESVDRYLSPAQLWRQAGARPVRVSPIPDRPWGEHLREAALFEWIRGVDGPTVIGEPIVWRRT